MSYDPVTYAMFIARFPRYTNTAAEDFPEPVVQASLDEAMRRVDNSWLESDYQDAVLYYAAHLLETESGDTAGGSTGGAPGVIASESFGPISTSYGSRGVVSSTQEESELATTVWGRRFIALRRANFPGIVAV